MSGGPSAYGIGAGFASPGVRLGHPAASLWEPSWVSQSSFPHGGGVRCPVFTLCGEGHRVSSLHVSQRPRDQGLLFPSSVPSIWVLSASTRDWLCPVGLCSKTPLVAWGD